MADHLGSGTDGSVWKTNRNTAVKVLQRQKNYDMELGCYQRLKLHNVTSIGRFAIPRLVDWDDKLWIVEMSMVSAPCLIDFGKAHLDSEPEHSAETWADYHQDQKEIWGDNYGEVQALLWQLGEMGIFYRDPKPGNIMFFDEDQSDTPPQTQP